MQLIKKFKRNEHGRDLLFGDIHGEFDLVLEAMAQAKVNPKIDRLFFVGDLIDRGTGSHRCAKFLAQPYVFAVRGNHEDMLIDIYKDGEPHPAILEFLASRNGFGWWMTTPENLRQEILASIRQLPLVIEIETARGSVGLIHAEVPIGMDWATFVKKINEEDAKATKSCLSGRKRWKNGDDSGVQGIGRVFVGHTPQFGGLARSGNIWYLDTGAVFAALGDHPEGCLTMANAVAATGVMLAPQKVVSLIDIRDCETCPPEAFSVLSTKSAA